MVPKTFNDVHHVKCLAIKRKKLHLQLLLSFHERYFHAAKIIWMRFWWHRVVYISMSIVKVCIVKMYIFRWRIIPDCVLSPTLVRPRRYNAALCMHSAPLCFGLNVARIESCEFVSFADVRHYGDNVQSGNRIIVNLWSHEQYLPSFAMTKRFIISHSDGPRPAFIT